MERSVANQDLETATADKARGKRKRHSPVTSNGAKYAEGQPEEVDGVNKRRREMTKNTRGKSHRTANQHEACNQYAPKKCTSRARNCLLVETGRTASTITDQDTTAVTTLSPPAQREL